MPISEATDPLDLLEDARTCLTHWDQGVAYSALARASRRTADYPSRVALLIYELATGRLPWTVDVCAPLFRDIDDGLAEWWATQHRMHFPYGRLLHAARAEAVRRDAVPPALSARLGTDMPSEVRHFPSRTDGETVALLPVGAAREELWMIGYEDAFRAHGAEVLQAIAASSHPVVCESVVAAWLIREILMPPAPPPPLALWLADNTSRLHLRIKFASPVVIQDSSALSRLYRNSQAVRTILDVTGIPYVEPLHAGEWAPAGAAEYAHPGLDEQTSQSIARRRYDELRATGACAIVAVDLHAAAALRTVAGGEMTVSTLRDLFVAEDEEYKE